MSRRPPILNLLLHHVLESGEFRAGAVHHVEVQHDPACGLWEGGICDCEPGLQSGARTDRRYGVKREGSA
jgi:hypothetical protein